mmetsp:Transcript_41252/g.62324  ORF Transcript_41252/g.62324 Transcript_41252/m.62324 type:complete len:98 (-) Transcript_41252:2-295(-)
MWWTSSHHSVARRSIDRVESCLATSAKMWFCSFFVRAASAPKVRWGTSSRELRASSSVEARSEDVVDLCAGPRRRQGRAIGSWKWSGGGGHLRRGSV